MPKRISIWGVGPKVGVLAIGYAAVVEVATLVWPRLFAIRSVPYAYLVGVAVALLAIAAPVYVITVRALRKAHHEGKLATTGTYGVCRNPLYALWIMLIIPALGLLLKSWLFLTAALFMYVATRILIRREEEYLQEQFGEEFTAYKRRVGAIFPTLWK